MPAAPPSGKGRTVVSDAETNGLLKKVSVVHCIAAIDVNTKEVFDWKPHEIEEGLRFLEKCDLVIGHNFLEYDARAIEKLHPTWKRPRIADTLVRARVIWPAEMLIGRDLKLVNTGRLPPRLLKSHKLEAWGYRLGEYKGEYDGGWEVWTQAMTDYMIQDCWVTVKLWDLIQKKINPPTGEFAWPEECFQWEEETVARITEQEDWGFPFNQPGAIDLAQRLQNEQAAYSAKLIDTFGSWIEPLDDPEKGTVTKKSRDVKRAEFPDVTLPRYGKNGKRLADYVGPPKESYTEGAAHVRVEFITFSPSNRNHLGKRLQAVYGWKPKLFGGPKNDIPTVDEQTIAAIDESVVPAEIKRLILNFFTAEKVLGQLSKGKKSWLSSYEADDGAIHGRMNTCGAITRRGTHLEPNLSQVPSVTTKDGAVVWGLEGGFGAESRSLFGNRLGELTGTDQTALELVLMGHYLAPFDGGAFAERVSDPARDIHTENGAITGLDRASTKTVTYAKVYGGGAWRVGEELTIEPDEIVPLLNYPMLPRLLTLYADRYNNDRSALTDRMMAGVAKGHIVVKKFEAGITGFTDLVEAVKGAATERGWLKAIDGSKLYVRKPHAALNTLLQGGGAIICKIWLCLTQRRLIEMGLVRRVDFHQVVWSHDETQNDHRPGLGPQIIDAAQWAAEETTRRLGLKAKLRVAGKTGQTWLDTH